MHDLTKRTNHAIIEAKKRDQYRCQVCFQGKDHGIVVEGAHALVRRAGYPWYHQDDKKWIVTLCYRHHRGIGGLDNFSAPLDRAQWFEDHGLIKYASLIRAGMNGELHEE